MKDSSVKYFGMGTWKTRIIKKMHKNKNESSSRGRSYIANPPVDGWKGGMPEQNGWKGR